MINLFILRKKIIWFPLIIQKYVFTDSFLYCVTKQKTKKSVNWQNPWVVIWQVTETM